MRHRKGFTLIEMMLVIAVIVILSAVFAIGMNQYIKKANGAQSTVSSHVGNFTSARNAVNSLGKTPS